VPGLRRVRTVIRGRARVRRRRQGQDAADDQGPDSGRGRGRDAHSAGRRGRDRARSGPPGDLFLEIVQRPHPIFERQGDDLHCTVTIPMVAAALGATLKVQTLDGPAEIDIRPGTQSGQAMPLYGQGTAH